MRLADRYELPGRPYPKHEGTVAVPEFQSFFRPLLEVAADGQELPPRSERGLASSMKLTQEDLSEGLPSGTQTKFYNRVAWAKSYFVQAKVLESARRGYFKITERGRELLKQGHSRISIDVLNQYPEFVEFHTPKPEESGTDARGKPVGNATPEELLQHAYQSIRNDLVSDLLARVKANSAEFFEHLVIDLMVSMGYGGSIADGTIHWPRRR